MNISAYEIEREAWRAFDRWLSDHDPDGDLGALEAVEAYYKWCNDQAILEGES